MARGIIQHISELLKDNNTDVLLIENNDKFLYRDDVIGALQKYGIEVFIGSSVEQRIQFELKSPDDYKLFKEVLYNQVKEYRNENKNLTVSPASYGINLIIVFFTFTAIK